MGSTKSGLAMTERVLASRLRALLRGELHAGRLRPGDRLPSIRQLAREHGADHRAVANVYGDLEREGLVEIRKRSGVFVARPQGLAPPNGTEAWIGAMLCEAQGRRIPLPLLADFIGWLAGGGIRCAVLDATEDHLVACEEELVRLFGLSVVPCRLKGRSGSGRLAERERLIRLLRGVDLAVTTSFHVAELEELAQQAGTPLIGVSISDRFGELLRQRLRSGGLTVVAADPSFIERAEAYFAGAISEGRLRIVSAQDPRAASLRPGADVLFTRAARRRLHLDGKHLLDEEVPYFSPETVRTLIAAMIRIASNRERNVSREARDASHPGGWE